MFKRRTAPHAPAMRTLLAVCLGASCVWSGVSWAQEAIYRCGHEYTNAPRDVSQCERLAPQAITVITGTRTAPPRVTPPVVAATPDARPAPDAMRSTSTLQTERDLQARTIVSHELDKARQQLTVLVQEYNEGEPVKWASESRHHQRYLDRVASLKAAIERTQRDIDSLQRELDRRPAVASSRAP